MSSLKTCPNCGNTVEDGNICPYCGTDLSGKSGGRGSGGRGGRSGGRSSGSSGGSVSSGGSGGSGDSGGSGGKGGSNVLIVILAIIGVIGLLMMAGIALLLFMAIGGGSDTANTTAAVTTAAQTTASPVLPDTTANPSTEPATPEWPTSTTPYETQTVPVETATEPPTVPPTTAAPNGDYIFPDSASRYLSRDELMGLSQEELKIARNEIYARRGRMFSTPEMQTYFNSKSWYYGTIPVNQFSETVFNDYEKENVKLIAAVETEKGYR